MRKNDYSKRRFSRLLVIMLALLLGWQAEAKANGRQPKDRLMAVEPHHERPQGAIFSDGQYLYRLCNSRPQRLTHSFSPPLTPGKGSGGHSHLPAPQCQCVHPHWKNVSQPTGFQFDASTRYYIFALRHILR